MAFHHRMTSATEGIDLRAPVRWRLLDGMLAIHWQAEGRREAGGYYLSPDPRIMVFLDPVGESIRTAEERRHLGGVDRPMGRAVYVPAGVPLWSRFTARQSFQHLDLHMDARRLHALLAPRLGGSAALAAIATPVSLDEAAHVEPLARLMTEEIARPGRPDLYAESLAQAIAAGLIAAAEPGQPAGSPAGPAGSGLSGAQMRRLRSHLRDNLHRRVGNAELAAAAGLSESWFAHAFKQAQGETPQQWQARLRIDRAREALAEGRESLSTIAQMLGFADQAHLTRVFRRVTGTTPAAWRHQQAGGAFSAGSDKEPQD